MGPSYNVRAQPLDTAQTKQFDLPGTYLEFATDGVMTGISVLIDTDSIPLDRFKQIRYPAGFEMFYLTWTSQAGKTLYIFVGREGTRANRV